ncbi:MAG TPA: EpsI family protein [Chthoniobacterales bacterium]|jgi:EpsI family protein
MITKRLTIVALVLLAGFSTVAFLPRAADSSPSGIKMQLPIFVGDWMGEDAAITQREREVLAPDTQFVRKTYTDLQGDQIYVSIVLSGDDMTNSIHRPERCLPAQGWSLQSSSRRNVALGDGRDLAVTELRDARIVQQKGANAGMLHGMDYYWFVGYHDMTPSHLERTGIDLRDRILHGYNQRWAYVTVASIVTKGWAEQGRSEAETEAMTEKFIRQLAPELKRPDGQRLL